MGYNLDETTFFNCFQDISIVREYNKEGGIKMSNCLYCNGFIPEWEELQSRLNICSVHLSLFLSRNNIKKIKDVYNRKGISYIKFVDLDNFTIIKKLKDIIKKEASK